jgi:hypothetical protein
MTRRSAAGWGQPAPGWGLPAATDPQPLRAAGTLGRWLWPITAVAGFLATVGYVLGHDDPRPGLSDRGWLALVLAAVVVVLTVRRAAGPGPLVRTLAEYAVVGLLAVLLATAGAGQQPAQRAQDGAGHRQPTERQQPAEHADAGTADRRPGIVRVVSGVRDWLAELSREAHQKAGRSAPPPSTATPKEGP